MDFDVASLDELRRRARDVAAQGVTEFGCYDDSWINGVSKPFSRVLAAEGWIGMTWPISAGGGGRPSIERLVVAEEMIVAGAPIAASWVADRQMGPSIIAFGTDEQRERFLPGILAGESTWCIGMSEPEAGSDLAALRTSATRKGGCWVINGQKIWTSLAATSDFCYLICRTATDGPKHQGISEIVVPMDTPGIEVRPILDLTGRRHFCEVFFSDVEVPLENLVGEEGGAFRQTMRQLEHERGGVDRLFSNRRLFNRAVLAADRADPNIRQRISWIESRYRIGRILVMREALRQAPAGFSAATKCFCTELEQHVANFASHVFGPAATVGDDLGRAIAYSPAYTIMGGTSNVMRNLLGERVLGLPREPR
jgi:alkylation response protein AidB-like acyl-CoA dehydrogenase